MLPPFTHRRARGARIPRAWEGLNRCAAMRTLDISQARFGLQFNKPDAARRQRRAVVARRGPQ
eukprot:11425672-Alexandrium_andersonii.AAC.1